MTRALCRKCDGEGFDEATQRPCPECNGTGQVEVCGNAMTVEGHRYTCELDPGHAGDCAEGPVRWQVVQGGVRL